MLSHLSCGGWANDADMFNGPAMFSQNMTLRALKLNGSVTHTAFGTSSFL